MSLTRRHFLTGMLAAAVVPVFAPLVPLSALAAPVIPTRTSVAAAWPREPFTGRGRWEGFSKSIADAVRPLWKDNWRDADWDGAITSKYAPHVDLDLLNSTALATVNIAALRVRSA